MNKIDIVNLTDRLRLAFDNGTESMRDQVSEDFYNLDLKFSVVKNPFVEENPFVDLGVSEADAYWYGALAQSAKIMEENFKDTGVIIKPEFSNLYDNNDF